MNLVIISNHWEGKTSSYPGRFFSRPQGGKTQTTEGEIPTLPPLQFTHCCWIPWDKLKFAWLARHNYYVEQNRQPANLADLVTPQRSARNLRSNSQNLFVPLRTKLTTTLRSFAFLHPISGTLFCPVNFWLVEPCLLSDTYSRPIFIHITQYEPSFSVHTWFLDSRPNLNFPWHPGLLYGSIGNLGVLGASVTLEFSSETRR